MAFVSGGGSVDDCNAVAFIRCHLDPPFNLNAATMVFSDSNVELFDTTVLGLAGEGGIFVTTPGEDAITLSGGDLYVYGSTVEGGRGGDGITACGPGSNGGDAIQMIGADPIVHVLDSTVVAGDGGLGTGTCANGNPGLAYRQIAPGSTVLQEPGDARGFVVSSPARDDDSFEVTYTGMPGDQVWVAYPGYPGPRVTHKKWNGPLVVGLPAPIVFVGTIPMEGELVQTIPLQDLGTGVEALPLFTQAYFLDTRFTVSTPSLLTIVDAAF